MAIEHDVRSAKDAVTEAARVLAYYRTGHTAPDRIGYVVLLVDLRDCQPLICTDMSDAVLAEVLGAVATHYADGGSIEEVYSTKEGLQ